MNKLILSILILPIFLTNSYGEINEACPSTQILVDGKCIDANYIDPIYWITAIIVIVSGSISFLIFYKKKK